MINLSNLELNPEHATMLKELEDEIADKDSVSLEEKKALEILPILDPINKIIREKKQ